MMQMVETLTELKLKRALCRVNPSRQTPTRQPRPVMSTFALPKPVRQRALLLPVTAIRWMVQARW
jgi:hypothetical protein